MSYRTEVNGAQLFGNNDVHPEWLEFVRSQGIEPDGDDWYEGEISDFMGALEACEKIALRVQADNMAARKDLAGKYPDGAPEKLLRNYPSLYDISYIGEAMALDGEFRGSVEKTGNGLGMTTLFDELYDLVHCGYLFLPMALYLACKDLLVPLDPEPAKNPDWRFRVFKLKPGKKIRVSAG